MAYLTVLSYILCIISYFHTSLRDPGIIRPSEDNSLENKLTLEPLGYTYCSICGVYRPPQSYHCSYCNVCFLKYVSSMEVVDFIDMIIIAPLWGNSSHFILYLKITCRQCVAKNNTISFYVFIITLLICLIFIEINGMTLLSHKNFRENKSVRTISTIISMLRNQHLRK